MTLLKNRTLLAAVFGHFSVDMYSGMLPLILLALTEPLGLSYAQIGFVSMTYSLAGSLSQPPFGWLGDRRGNRPMAVVGVAAIATTVGVMRFVDNYVVLVILAIVAGLGSGAFHPQGAMLAAQTPKEQRGIAASLFMLGGNSGYAFGPLFGAAVFGLAGGRMRETLAILGLLQAALVFWLLAERQRQFRNGSQPQIMAATTMAPMIVIITLTLIMFLRSWMSHAVSTYVPQVFKSFGYSNPEAGAVLSAILFPLAFGGLVGGALSDKIGRRRVLIVSTAISGPALWMLLQNTGVMAFVWAVILGASIGASVPVTLVMAQSLVPRGLGLMSGIVLGFTFISGAFGVAVSGVAADWIGLLPAMNLNGLLPIMAAGLAFLLPDDKPTTIPISTN